jgi:hypothetical protein
MSIASIRAALETALNAMSPALATAFENVTYTPVQGAPYQRVNLLLAGPDNSEISPGYIERGIFQVTLAYPIDTGPAAAAARAILLRSTFKCGNSFSNGGITVLIMTTPQVGPGMIDEDRYVLPVKVRFQAYVPS